MQEEETRSWHLSLGVLCLNVVVRSWGVDSEPLPKWHAESHIRRLRVDGENGIIARGWGENIGQISASDIGIQAGAGPIRRRYDWAAC